MRHSNFKDEIYTYEGNDWLGMFFATLAALVVAVMVIALVNTLSGGELLNSLME